MNNSTTQTYGVDEIKELATKLQEAKVYNNFTKSVFGTIAGQRDKDGNVYMTQKQKDVLEKVMLDESEKRKAGEDFLNDLVLS